MKKILTIAILAAILPFMLCDSAHAKRSSERKNRNTKVTKRTGRRTRRKQTKKIYQIPHLTAETCDYEQTKGGVTVRAKTLRTDQECTDAFGRNGKYLLRRRKRLRQGKIYPIKVTIENNGNRSTSLSKKNIKLKTVPLKQVLTRLHCQIFIHVAGPGLVILGVGAIATGSLLYSLLVSFGAFIGHTAISSVWSGIFFASLGIIVATPIALLSVPAILGVRAHNKNIESTALTGKPLAKQKPLVIEPGKKESLFLFVRQEEYTTNFNLALNGTELTNNSHSFDIQLPEVDPKKLAVAK